MALGSTISVDSLQEWRSNLKRIEKHDPRLGALVATHSKVWAVGQVLNVTLPGRAIGERCSQRDSWPGQGRKDPTGEYRRTYTLRRASPADPHCIITHH